MAALWLMMLIWTPGHHENWRKNCIFPIKIIPPLSKSETDQQHLVRQLGGRGLLIYTLDFVEQIAISINTRWTVNLPVQALCWDPEGLSHLASKFWDWFLHSNIFLYAKVSGHEQSRIFFGTQLFHHKFTTKNGFFFHGVQTKYDIYMHNKKSEHVVW